MSAVGDEASRTVLAEEALAHADSLYNLARHLTGNPAEADNLVQETYARALGAAEQFLPGSNLKAWLLRILRNAFIDMYRRKRHDPMSRRAEDGELDDTAAEGRWLHGDCELHHLRSIVAADIEAAFVTLSEDARAVILLDLEGLSEGEVAEALGCAVGTVKSRLAQARVTLRRRLSEYAR